MAQRRIYAMNFASVYPLYVAKAEKKGRTKAEVDAAYAAAMAAGATDNGKPGVRLYYDPRYYAGNVFDPDGYSLEFVFKSWQHPQP